jgi:hypothetical protein
MRSVRAWALPALVLLFLAGCSETHVTRPVNRAPSPSTPQGVVRLFAWCWNNQDTTRYREVFTDDFRFVFAAGDSVGQSYPNGLGRDEMLACARHLFVGGGTAPPAASITLLLDATLLPLNDSRPGKNPKWHKEVPTSVHLTVETQEGVQYNVTGNATFFVVRGDSAMIPPELGFAPDSTRWYIERWEDYTLSDDSRALPAASPQPARPTSWGTILALYK